MMLKRTLLDLTTTPIKDLVLRFYFSVKAKHTISNAGSCEKKDRKTDRKKRKLLKNVPTLGKQNYYKFHYSSFQTERNISIKILQKRL